MQADGAVSKKDFRPKITLCKKEAKETKHWLRMIAKADPGEKEACRKFGTKLKRWH
jgi:four helix bundle protein